MKLRTKMAILIAALVITLAGFNLIVSSSSLASLKIGQPAAYEIVVIAYADPRSPAHSPS